MQPAAIKRNPEKTVLLSKSVPIISKRIRLNKNRGSRSGYSKKGNYGIIDRSSSSRYCFSSEERRKREN